MNPSPETRDRLEADCRTRRAGDFRTLRAGRRLVPGLLLALLGAWSLATMGAAGSGAAGGGSVANGAFASAALGFQAASAPRADDPSLLHSPQRRSGIQTLQPSGKEDDPDDNEAGGQLATAGRLPDGREVSAPPTLPPVVDAVTRRPLHGPPQNPRAPPNLA